MFKQGEIRQNLLGCLETALFMRAGLARFCPSRESMMKSFIIPLILLPLTLITVLSAHPAGALSADSMQILAIIYSLRLFVYLGAFLAFVYAMARTMDKLEDFYRFATANNWLAIPAAVLMTPLLILFLNGHYQWTEVYPLMVVITLYSYAYTAFMAMHVMRVPAELGVFIAIAGMAIHQTSLGLLKVVAVGFIQMIA
ncbi:MAG: hypothetical protein H6861_07670 [Rhodospirillales bacterium]|nr:hypothetical protein [Rhodospirillales bacterium]